MAHVLHSENRVGHYGVFVATIARMEHSPLKEIVELLSGGAGYIIIDEVHTAYIDPKAGASSLCLD